MRVEVTTDVSSTCRCRLADREAGRGETATSACLERPRLASHPQWTHDACRAATMGGCSNGRRQQRPIRVGMVGAGFMGRTYRSPSRWRWSAWRRCRAPDCALGRGGPGRWRRAARPGAGGDCRRLASGDTRRRHRSGVGADATTAMPRSPSTASARRARVAAEAAARHPRRRRRHVSRRGRERWSTVGFVHRNGGDGVRQGADRVPASGESSIAAAVPRLRPRPRLPAPGRRTGQLGRRQRRRHRQLCDRHGALSIGGRWRVRRSAHLLHTSPLPERRA